MPAAGLDITGYQLIQSNTLKTFTFPATTTVDPGGYVIVGRNASEASFESFWGVTLATNVVYINAANNFPKIDGGERFVLRNAGGAGIDGPTPASIDPLNRSIQRKSAVSSGTLSSSWYVVTSSAATPGTGGAGTNSSKLVINEYTDTGSFSYEFVELFYDAALSNVPPVLLAIPDQVVTVSNRLQFSVTATPTDGDTVTLSASNAPAGSTLSATNENGTFIWTNAAPLGVYTTRIYAADNDGASWKAVKISVLDPPSVSFHVSELVVSEDVGTQQVAVVISRAADVDGAGFRCGDGAVERLLGCLDHGRLRGGRRHADGCVGDHHERHADGGHRDRDSDADERGSIRNSLRRRSSCFRSATTTPSRS